MIDRSDIVQMRARRPLKAGQMCTSHDVAPWFERDAPRPPAPLDVFVLPDGMAGIVIVTGDDKDGRRT